MHEARLECRQAKRPAGGVSVRVFWKRKTMHASGVREKAGWWRVFWKRTPSSERKHVAFKASYTSSLRPHTLVAEGRIH